MATRTDRTRATLIDSQGQSHPVRVETHMLERWISHAGMRTLAETRVVDRTVSLEETGEPLLCRDGLWMTADRRLVFPAGLPD